MKVAILGSSGGNLFNLGGRDPEKLLGEILVQCQSAGIEVAAVQFIAAQESMDVAKGKTLASLYSWNIAEQTFVKGQQNNLATINDQAKSADEAIAALINNKEVDGIIIMSGDPEGTNNAAITAAAKFKLPIVGTGGTSMAMISTKGADVIATSGTTGTTNRTRAVSFVTSLSKQWNIKYMPVLGHQGNNGQGSL